MSSAPQILPFSQVEQLRAGRQIIRHEAEALLTLGRKLDAAFCLAVDLFLNCSGSVIVCGIGKAGIIGQKLAATLASTGTRAHFLHPAEAVHGDLGCLHPEDVLLALSNSGETDEILAIIPGVKQMGLRVVSITASSHSSLGRQSDLVIEMGRLREACPWNLAPTTTTTAMLAIGDALAMVVSQARGFTPQNFAQLHPAGSLGQRLKPVIDVMRPRDQLRVASEQATVREAIAGSARLGRRSGAVLIVDHEERLIGIFTDSDLARLFESRRDGGLDESISNVMTKNPLTVRNNALFSDVIDLLAERKISELPVVDAHNKLMGLIDITDVIGWIPAETQE